MFTAILTYPCWLEDPLLVLLIACVQPDDNRFPNGGDPWTLPDETDTSASTDDTGDLPSGAPVIDDVLAGWCDLPQVGDVIAVYITFRDGESDVEGGRVLLTVDGETVKVNGVQGVPIDSNGDSQEARILDSGSHTGDVFFVALPPDKDDYELELRLRDTEENTSDTYTTVADSDLAEELCTGNTGG